MAITKKTLMEELELMVRDDEISQKTIIRLSEENKILKDRIDKVIDYITTEQLYTNYQWGKSQYVKILNDLLKILRGKDNENR